MSTKEVEKPYISEGIVRDGDINLLKYIFPTNNIRLEVIKSEGDLLDNLDNTSKLPKGYSLIRLVSPYKATISFRKDIEEAKIAEAISKKHSSDQKAVLKDINLIAKSQTVEPGPGNISAQVGNRKNCENTSHERSKQKHSDYLKIKPKNEDSLGYFNILNLDPKEIEGSQNSETAKKIKTKYQIAAQKAHPDHGGTNEKMVLVNRAYEVISNPNLRRNYRKQAGTFTPKTN